MGLSVAFRPGTRAPVMSTEWVEALRGEKGRRCTDQAGKKEDRLEGLYHKFKMGMR